MVDTIVVGGGIAGLQTAVQLARGLHDVLVIDRGDGRSRIARMYRNVLGFPEGISGIHLRKIGVDQAKRLGVRFVDGEVTTVRRTEQGFAVFVTDRREPYLCRTLVLATGITDRIPDVPGLAACLGESVFICPDCDGYEAHRRRTVVLGAGKPAVHMTESLLYYTDQLALVVHGDPALDRADLERLRDQGITLYQQRVERVLHEGGRISGLLLADGRRVEAERGFVAFPGTRVNAGLAKALGVRLLANGHVPVDPRTKETSCPNVWAVGDMTAHSQMVTIAMGDGSQAAVWIHKRLLGLTRPELTGAGR